LSRTENAFERARWHELLEVYAPVREDATGRVLAVTEFYQLPNELEAETTSVRRRSWAVVAGVVVAMYALLAAIVKRGSDTITRQQRALNDRVTDLARLHERVRQAAERTTALNEQALRRIGADLHDGPGQALALALLRLDPPRAEGVDAAPSAADMAVVLPALQDALREMRAIAAGLRLPELADLPVAAVVERAVRDHERRTGIPVAADASGAPWQVPLAVKIALYRSLQEALSNATRHAEGRDIEVRVWQEDSLLCLMVTDRGPGFVAEDGRPSDRLGLAGIRERSELLGGTFTITSVLGQGTSVRVCWPLTMERMDVEVA
jgi:signal transduction histidine kinase